MSRACFISCQSEDEFRSPWSGKLMGNGARSSFRRGGRKWCRAVNITAFFAADVAAVIVYSPDGV